MTHRFTIQIFVIAALVSAMISPACHFMGGGKLFMALCGVQDTLALAAVPEEFKPYLLDQGQQQEPSPQKQPVEDCSFCQFAATQAGFVPDIGIIAAFFDVTKTSPIGAGATVFVSQSRTAPPARGPPVFS